MDDLDMRAELSELAGALADQARTLRSFGLRHLAARQAQAPVAGPVTATGAPLAGPAAAEERSASVRPAGETPPGRSQAHLFAQAERAAPAAPVQPGAPDLAPHPPEEAAALLQNLERSMAGCELCGLCRSRKTIVFGEGSPSARLVLVGEGPGAEEDRTGRPFVGPAGQLLDRILAAMGLVRSQVYICNVVKCRPPRNRTPEEREMRTCGLFLARQLDAIRPRFILALGATAARYLLNTDQAMSRIRGRFYEHPSGARIMPTYHPAFLLRNESAKRPVWEDVQKVMAELNRPEGAMT